MTGSKSVLKAVVILMLLPASVVAKSHHHISVDTTPESGFTIERDTYAQGSYYYPTFTQSYGEFSVGLSGQNLSTWDVQNAIYGIVTWTHDWTDSMSTTLGTMDGIIFQGKQADVFNYALVNYDFCDNFTLSVGTAMENGILALNTAATITAGDFSLQPFYIPGNTNMAGAGVNVNYQLTERLQPYVGYGFAGESYLAIGFNINY